MFALLWQNYSFQFQLQEIASTGQISHTSSSKHFIALKDRNPSWDGPTRRSRLWQEIEAECRPRVPGQPLQTGSSISIRQVVPHLHWTSSSFSTRLQPFSQVLSRKSDTSCLCWLFGRVLLGPARFRGRWMDGPRVWDVCLQAVEAKRDWKWTTNSSSSSFFLEDCKSIFHKAEKPQQQQQDLVCTPSDLSVCSAVCLLSYLCAHLPVCSPGVHAAPVVCSHLKQKHVSGSFVQQAESRTDSPGGQVTPCWL